MQPSEKVDPINPGPSEIISNRRVGPEWYVLRLREPSIARRSRPGQFVQICCSEGESYDPLLRRPMSVYCVDRAAGTYEIIYAAVGRGTRWLAALPDRSVHPEADGPRVIDVLGPLGNSFTPPRPNDRVYLVGGGVGVSPLYFLACEMLASPESPEIAFCMGARTSSQLQGIDDFRRLALRTEVATEDGSEGFRGLVTELFTSLVAEETDRERIIVYGCGPQGMNDSLRAATVERNLRCEIALESLMACGFGICFGCVAPIRKEVGTDYVNRRICWDGPVFDARLLHPGIVG